MKHSGPGLSLPHLTSTESPSRDNNPFNPLQASWSDGLSQEAAHVLENALRTKNNGFSNNNSNSNSNVRSVSSSVDTGRRSTKSRGDSRRSSDNPKVMV